MQESTELADVRAAIEESLSGAAPPQPAPEPDDESLSDIDAQAASEDDEAEDDAAIVEEQEQGVEKLVDLAAQIGVEPSELYGLKVSIEDGGETRTLTIGELKDQYLTAASERVQIAQQREQVDAKQRALEQAAMKQSQAAGQMSERMIAAQGVMHTLQSQYKSFEESWAQREAENPGQVALERQRVGERFSQAQAEYQAASGEQAQQAQQARQAWMNEQHQLVTAAVPDWGDPVKRQKMANEISEFVTSTYGVPKEALEGIDARTIQMALDAMEGRKLKAKAQETVQGVKRRGIVVPKGMKVGSKAKAKHEESLINQARSSGRSQDKMAAARAIFNSK